MEQQGTKAAAFDPAPRRPRPTPAFEAPAPRPAPVTPPPAPRPSSPPAEVTDFIPEDVDSSFGGATGDLWADDWNEELPPQGGGAPDEDAATEDASRLTAPGQQTTQARSSSRQAPAARPAQSSEGRRAPRGATKPTASQPAFAPKVVSTDSPQGRAFAELVELFPGKIIEVVPLRQAADADDESGAQAATEATFADGYDDPTGAASDNDDARES